MEKGFNIIIIKEKNFERKSHTSRANQEVEFAALDGNPCSSQPNPDLKS